MIHHLKTWPEYFNAVAQGLKTFEVRKDDRPFRRGDRLVLQEFDPQKQVYTGKEITVRVTYLARGDCIPAGFCAMAIRVAP